MAHGLHEFWRTVGPDVASGSVVVSMVLYTILSKYVGDTMDDLKKALSDLAISVQAASDRITALSAQVAALKASEATAVQTADLAPLTAAVTAASSKLAGVSVSS